MKRTGWKWLLGLSIVVLVLLVLFIFGAWALLNICGALFLTLLGNAEITAISFPAFVENFIGSPIFYIFLMDFAALFGALIMLIVTRKRHK